MSETHHKPSIGVDKKTRVAFAAWRAAIKADRQQRGKPVAVIRFERNKPGNENEMPKVISCNRLPDGDYRVFLAPQPSARQQREEPSDDEIREVFLANGFTIKDWRNDLMPYVYDAARALLARYGQSVGSVAWRPISTAPTDNKRPLYLSRFREGELVELDFNGGWGYWQESYEMPHINGYAWVSNNGIEEPTHWAYQDEPLPTTAAAGIYFWNEDK